jgi:hypothetical protein
VDARPPECLVPSRRADLLDLATFEREHDVPVLADLLLQDRHGFAVQRHRNRLPGLRLVWMNPSETAIEIDR